MKNTVFNDVRFLNCKLMGARFDFCKQFLLTVCFENCVLKFTSFYKLKLRKTHFAHCNLQEADFTQTDLSGAIFNNCDLLRALFEETNLEKVDFTTSYNYTFDPEKNHIKKARFSASGISGLLVKYDIIIE